MQTGAAAVVSCSGDERRTLRPLIRLRRSRTSNDMWLSVVCRSVTVLRPAPSNHPRWPAAIASRDRWPTPWPLKLKVSLRREWPRMTRSPLPHQYLTDTRGLVCLPSMDRLLSRSVTLLPAVHRLLREISYGRLNYARITSFVRQSVCSCLFIIPASLNRLKAVLRLILDHLILDRDLRSQWDFWKVSHCSRIMGLLTYYCPCTCTE